MGKKTECRERAVHSSVSSLYKSYERGDPPVTGRLPRTSGPRNLRHLLPVATLLLGKRALEKTWPNLRIAVLR